MYKLREITGLGKKGKGKKCDGPKNGSEKSPEVEFRIRPDPNGTRGRQVVPMYMWCVLGVTYVIYIYQFAGQSKHPLFEPRWR